MISYSDKQLKIGPRVAALGNFCPHKQWLHALPSLVSHEEGANTFFHEQGL